MDDIKVGTRCVFRDDGAMLVVDVVKSECDLEYEGYTLHIVREVRPPYHNIPAPVGEEFSVRLMRGFAFGGMWTIERLDDFISRRPDMEREVGGNS